MQGVISLLYFSTMRLYRFLQFRECHLGLIGLALRQFTLRDQFVEFVVGLLGLLLRLGLRCLKTGDPLAIAP